MTLHRSFLVILAVLVAACTDPYGPAPDEPLFSAGGVTPQVVGSGHNETAAGLREFTFHAIANADGAKGSFKVVLPNGLFFEADVTCVSTDDNIGWVGGIIRDTNAGVVVIGSSSWFYAIDGGQGAGSTDIVSVAVFNAAAGAELAFCADQPLELPQLAVTQGNVQVR